MIKAEDLPLYVIKVKARDNLLAALRALPHLNRLLMVAGQGESFPLDNFVSAADLRPLLENKLGEINGELQAAGIEV